MWPIVARLIVRGLGMEEASKQQSRSSLPPLYELGRVLPCTELSPAASRPSESRFMLWRGLVGCGDTGLKSNVLLLWLAATNSDGGGALSRVHSVGGSAWLHASSPATKACL